jgi:galactokinase
MAYIPSDDDEITINNIDKDEFPGEVISTDPHQKFRESAHWLNYFLCGYKAILALTSPLKDTVKRLSGMKILIESLVPPAAGLSSSSAFTVCAAVTTLHANGLIMRLD